MSGDGRRGPRRFGRIDPDGSRLRWPGARARFGLFGEVLWTGVLVALICIPIVTWPAAVAAGGAHLRRYVRAEASSARLFVRDVRSALPGGAVIGAGTLVGGALLAFDVLLASGGRIPGGGVVAWAGLGVGALSLGWIVLAAGLWRPGLRWRTLLAAVPRAISWDPLGALSSVVAVVLVAVLTWQLLPLAIPGLGLLAFAGMAIAERRAQRIEREQAASAD